MSRHRTIPAALAIGAGAVMLIVAWHFYVDRVPASLREVPRANLELRNGRMYEAGGTAPFSGVSVESNSDGSLLARLTFANGQLNGVAESWYTNGQLQAREHFRNGVSHGLREKWHENGARMTEARIVQGKLEGTFRRWHANGQLAEQIPMKRGNPDGIALAYYPSGCLKARTRVESGKIIAQQTWRDGEVRENEAASSF